MITSVGMLGVEQAFVPFTPFAKVPMLFMVGDITKRAIVGADDKIIAQRMLTLTGTMDHRYADGTEAAKLSKKLKFILENPQLLDETAPAAASSAASPKSSSDRPSSSCSCVLGEC